MREKKKFTNQVCAKLCILPNGNPQKCVKTANQNSVPN